MVTKKAVVKAVVMRYRNPHLHSIKKSLWHFLLWKLGVYRDLEGKQKPLSSFSFPIEEKGCRSGLPKVMWLGHASFLIEVEGVRFLTDPVFSEYCAPIPLKMFRRRHPVPLAIEALPDIHFVLLSHNHYDHLDLKTLSSLKKRFSWLSFIVPMGLQGWMKKQGFSRTFELGWWDQKELFGTKILSVPAQHFSGRGLLDKNKTLWCGYVVEIGKKKIYFSGDTGYNGVDFSAIGKLGPMDLSLLPIGTYVPRPFMHPVHCSPEEAVQIHQEVRSKFSLGMHWKTFCLSEEPMQRPPYDLYRALQNQGLDISSFLPVEPGRELNF